MGDLQSQIRENVKTLQGQIEICNYKTAQIVNLLALQRKLCTHPNKFRGSTMGESCDICPDCGWSS